VAHGWYVSEFAHFNHNPALTLEIIDFTVTYNIEEIYSILTPCYYVLRIPRITNGKFFPVQRKEFKLSRGDRLCKL